MHKHFCRYICILFCRVPVKYVVIFMWDACMCTHLHKYLQQSEIKTTKLAEKARPVFINGLHYFIHKFYINFRTPELGELVLAK